MELTPLELARIVGANVRRRRTELGWSQVTLAKKAKMPQGHLSDLENGKRPPNLGTVAELAEALEIQPCDLLSLPTPTAA